MPKATTQTGNGQPRRHNPLGQDILATKIVTGKAPKAKARRTSDEEPSDGSPYIDSRTSKKILQLAQELSEQDQSTSSKPVGSAHNPFGLNSRPTDGISQDDDEPDDDVFGDDDESDVDASLDPEALKTFHDFFPHDDDPIQWTGQTERTGFTGTQETNLADLILAKISAHEAGRDMDRIEETGPDEIEFSPRVIEVYTKVGIFMSRYKSGKLPKPFKVLPSVPGWERIIELTNPPGWTTNACSAATRIFVSSGPVVARRFVEMILLDRVRDDIDEHKKLSPHLWDALKKSLFRPEAFFNGFLFPLVSSGSCTLKEAHIISGILLRVSVPVLHSAAAIKALCDIASGDLGAAGVVNTFLKTLLEKRYALPWQAIDSLVFHFLRMKHVGIEAGEKSLKEGGRPTVIWHQCLLVFAQRYRNEITEDQREALLDLLLEFGHNQITPEIRRELLAGRTRGVQIAPPPEALDGDDTMQID
ncbi:putative bystin-like protein [Rosellinia necatrix]|uniref:Putative bystin-like protein n=1 Tax=Rosellinia necatrix TaxID=77044 RepID=A0A1S7UQ81_ROSNE|nr:putative bystin-like protein [Rosellinia necatrix]